MNMCLSLDDVKLDVKMGFAGRNAGVSTTEHGLSVTKNSCQYRKSANPGGYEGVSRVSHKLLFNEEVVRYV